MHANVRDLTGRTFGRLKVFERAPRPADAKGRGAHWQCLCECGNFTYVRSDSLVQGWTQSCGCLRIEASRERMELQHESSPKTDGSEHPEQRCTKSNPIRNSTMSETKQTNSNTNGYQPERGATMSPPPGPRSKAAILVQVSDLQDLRAKFAALETPNLALAPASRAAIEWLDLQLAFAFAHRGPNALREMPTEQQAREADDHTRLRWSEGVQQEKPTREHAHYFRDVSALDEVDIYRMLELFGVTDQALGHAIKKLIVPGMRGAKDRAKDVKEAIDTLLRWQEMRREDANAALTKQRGQG